jgi:hypothetical protein
MKIAAIVPIGPLDKWGYQYIYQPCIESIVAFADKVYLVNSTRENNIWPTCKRLNALEDTYKKQIKVISNLSTLFSLDDNHKEYFESEQVAQNANKGLRMARIDGYDIGVYIDINQYVPEPAQKPLREYCYEVLRCGTTHGWLYRRDQLVDRTFHSSLRRPWIFNLHSDAEVSNPDGAIWDGKRTLHQRGFFFGHDYKAIVDCPLEMTLEDMDAKFTAFRMYRDLVPKRPKYSWEYMREYSINKFRQKNIDPLAKLDKFGRMIADISTSRPDFLSHEILEALR